MAPNRDRDLMRLLERERATTRQNLAPYLANGRSPSEGDLAVFKERLVQHDEVLRMIRDVRVARERDAGVK